MIRTALIAGAGLGGMAAALSLARQGVHVRVVEKAKAIEELGAGIQLSPNAMLAARSMGVEAQIVSAGFEPETAEIRHFSGGRTYLKAPLAEACRRRYGAPYIHIHRADLLGLLVDAARDAGAEIETDAPVAGYEPGPPAALRLQDGRRLSADVLIGADGVRSVLREQMLGVEAPDFTGQVAWRGVLPTTPALTGLIKPSATVWVGSGRHLVTYYLRGGTLVNFVAVEERSAWRKESWTEQGDPAALRAAFAGWGPEVTGLLEQVEETFLWALFDRKPLARWSEGAVVLVGDACHPMLPFMAQGAAMAFEDACVLTNCLLSDDNVAKALSRYEALRKPRTTAIQAKARANAQLFHMHGLGAKAKLLAAALLPSNAALRQLDPIYGYDPTKAV